MRQIFLSHSFADRDRALVTHVEAVIRSHGLVATNGRALAGGGLTPEVAQKIEGSDALIALVTKRENDPGNLTSPWVLQELGHARFNKMSAIGFYELGVPQQAADQGNERIDYDPQAPVDGFVRLSETLGEWKRRAGRMFKIQVMPDEVARPLGARADRVTCQVRFQVHGVESEWQQVRGVRREAGSVFIYLRVPEEAEMLQLRCEGPPACESDYTPLWMPVHLAPQA